MLATRLESIKSVCDEVVRAARARAYQVESLRKWKRPPRAPIRLELYRDGYEWGSRVNENYGSVRYGYTRALANGIREQHSLLWDSMSRGHSRFVNRDSRATRCPLGISSLLNPALAPARDLSCTRRRFMRDSIRTFTYYFSRASTFLYGSYRS